VQAGRGTADVGEGELRRELGTFLAACVIVNATIGTGIFRKPGQIVRLAGSLDAALLTWIAGGFVALAGALTLAELAAALPRTGGMYEYLRRAYGPVPAFVLGWTRLVLLVPSAVGSFARLGGEALAGLLGQPSNASLETGLALAVLTACTLVNLGRVRVSGIGQGILTSVKYVGVVALACVGLFAAITPGADIPVPAEPLVVAPAVTWTGCFAALVSVMWAYDGWGDLSSLAGETKDPARVLPRAHLLGVGLVIVLYGAVVLGYDRVLGFTGLTRSTTGSNMVAMNVMTLTVGEVGRRALSFLILVSCVGACLGSLLTGPRAFVAMATDGLFPKALGRVAANGVPVRAVLLCFALGVAYVSLRSFEQLTDGFVIGLFPFYALAVLAVIVLRKKEPELVRPYRVPLYPLTPIVFLVGAIAVLIGAASEVAETTSIAIGVVLTGIPIGYARARMLR
jgi:APA family basic amino acid/polyamine antiporter